MREAIARLEHKIEAIAEDVVLLKRLQADILKALIAQKEQQDSLSGTVKIGKNAGMTAGVAAIVTLAQLIVEHLRK